MLHPNSPTCTPPDAFACARLHAVFPWLAIVDDGGTATHEIGHLFGLYHTFQGGCTPHNDGIDDTPACVKSFSCSPGDTCPSRPGLDAASNYMSCEHPWCTRSPHPQQTMVALAAYGDPTVILF